jgi:hypothetical protein
MLKAVPSPAAEAQVALAALPSRVSAWDAAATENHVLVPIMLSAFRRNKAVNDPGNVS